MHNIQHCYIGAASIAQIKMLPAKVLQQKQVATRAPLSSAPMLHSDTSFVPIDDMNSDDGYNKHELDEIIHQYTAHHIRPVTGYHK